MLGVSVHIKAAAHRSGGDSLQNNCAMLQPLFGCISHFATMAINWKAALLF
jgi:hypothetical protein